MRKSLLVIMVASAWASPVGAMERGERCVLQAPLPLVVQSPRGRVELTVDPGVEVTVVAVGAEGRTGISTGDASGTVSTSDLDAACAGTLQACALTGPVTMFEKTRSDSKAWRVKAGATLNVLRSGKAWSHVRVDDLEGYCKADDLKPVCRPKAIDTGATRDGEIAEQVERAEGPGVLYLPFLLDQNAPAGQADAVADLFFEQLAIYRPDVARLPLAGDRAAVKWKKHTDETSTRARDAGMNYAIVGQLSTEAIDGKQGLVLNLAVVDTRARAVLKGIRVRPTLKPGDVWIDNALAVLLPFVASAPNAPAPPTMKGPPSTPAPPTKKP